ncbi:uncharacterized protein LOC129746513 [Uranotaenia lowii]|uniref:uncharacterized protein LOC129746513 n=1 Tax=Uranotaenia lowii TaxID=190385 RepID=UPI002478475B|nr:uncharacterized protein LOC129746513 [Uranotaenia lowii]
MRHFICAFLFSFTTKLVWGQCSVNIRTDLTSPEPIFFKGNSLWYPDNGSLRWAAGETTDVSCGSGALNGYGVSYASITCISGTTFLINGASVDSTALVCSQRPLGEISIMRKWCSEWM